MISIWKKTAEQHRAEILQQGNERRARRENALTYIRASERLASMVGMNAVQGHAITVIHQEAPVKQQTSTEKIRAAIDQIQGVTARERELEDKRSDRSITADEWTELDELRTEREAKMDAKRKAEREAERMAKFGP